MIYDLAIAGGGPAGTSAALTAAARGLSVVLCERGTPGRDKVCGEFISPEALPLLARWIPALLDGAPAVTAASLTAADGQRARFPLPQPARGISRLALDASLWQAAASAGVCMKPQSAIAAMGDATLQTATGEVIHARHILWAAGRAPAPRPHPRFLGLKARFTGLPQLAEVELFALRGGYCGLAPVENGWTNVCCLLGAAHAPSPSRSGDFAAWLTQLAGSAPLCARLRGAQQATPTVVTAGIALGPCPAPRGATLAAGDASGFIDPFTGDGIARALLSGHLAAQAVAAGTVSSYPKALAASARRGFRSAALLRSALSAPPWAQAAAIRLLAHPALSSRLVNATRWHSSLTS